MARITRVNKAQQRYATTVVRDAEGNPVRTPVMTRGGTQMVTKQGRPVFMTKTVADKTAPLPMPTCDYCHEPIEVGQPYKHITPKSGPYGGHTLNRHSQHPDWHVWDYSSSLSARTAQISYNAWETVDKAESTDDVQSLLADAAQEIRDLAGEKRESASNIEDGFGHETQTSMDLNDVADQLDSWADDVENADVPDLPEPDEVECDNCGGDGTVTEECAYCGGTGLMEETVEADEDTDPEEECTQCEGTGETEEECPDCNGTGQVTPDDPTDEQMDAWRDEVRDALSVLDDCPV